MRKLDRAGFLVFLIKGKINDPAHFKCIFVNQSELFRNLVAQPPAELVKFDAGARHKQNRVALFEAELVFQFIHLFFTEETGNSLGAGSGQSHIGNAAHALFLGKGVKLVKERARLVGNAGNRHRLYRLAFFGQVVINAETAVAEKVRRILQHQRIAQIRLVGTVFHHCFAERNADKRRLVNLFAVGKFVENGAERVLNHGKHVVLSGKTHLHIHLIEFTRRPVGAGILIAKTRRNLKIFVKTRHHQQLLKLLRRLRQGIKLTRIKPRRHQKVARPFRRRSGQNRRLIFGKTLLAHQLAGTFNHRRTQQNVFVNALLAQIEETVFQTNFFRRVVFNRHLERQHFGLGINLQPVDFDFDFPGRNVFVNIFADHRFAVNADHRFNPDPLHFLKQRRGAVKHALGYAVMVAQIHKTQIAEIAFAVHPARQSDSFAGIRRTQLPAGKITIFVHLKNLKFWLACGLY